MPATDEIVDQLSLSVGGMVCAGCAASAQSKLSQVAGVENATVDFASGVASVEGREIKVASIVDAVQRAGFDATLHAPKSAAHDPLAALVELQAGNERNQIIRESQWFRRMLVAGSIWVVLETLHWTVAHDHSMTWVGWTMFFGTSFALVFAGGGFFSSAWRAGRHGTTNMDTLVVIGVSASFALSTWIFFAQQFMHTMLDSSLYFAEATALLGIISGGHWLESRGTSRANSAVKELLQLQPESAERLDKNGALEIIPAASIQIGDRINVRPGGRISVDGTVLEGRASVDESSLTGEPLPILRQVGDSVSSGTIALDGRLVVRVVACGSASALGRIAQLVYEAQITQAPIQRYADRICRIFVPAVLVIALATFFMWWSMATLNVAVITAVTVLVISCPCALGIATPLAVMVGTGEASRRGILVRRATALQTSAQVRTVIFDKTGTITTGRPTLDQVEVIDNRWSQEQLLGWAAAAEMQSEHPLARAVVIEAQARKIDIPSAENFIAEPGVGVRATVEGKVIAVVRDEIASARIEVDGSIAARLTLTDRARPESAAAIAALRSMGCAVGMLTGDRKASALVVASAAGLRSDEVMADQTPESKSAAIAARGASTVMMIGDGINDAGALSAAGIGVAMGSGTALAAASADAILLRDDPRGVAELIGVARETIGVVRQNLFLAFIYNAAAIPLAALGFLGANGPIIAAVAMGLSDISVVANTLRLRAKLSGQRKRLASGTPSV